jgi:uncharacterized membrane protein
MMPTTHPLATDYLRRLDAAAAVLPALDRDELVAQIRDHVDAGLAPDATEADVRNLLDDLGSPEQIVAAARQENALVNLLAADVQPPRRIPVFEIVALMVLVIGFLATPPLIGWIPGAALVLMSRVWTWRDKLIGIALLLVPLAMLLVWVGASVNLAPMDSVFVGQLLLASVVVGYLGWRLRGRTRA